MAFAQCAYAKSASSSLSSQAVVGAEPKLVSRHFLRPSDSSSSNLAKTSLSFWRQGAIGFAKVCVGRSVCRRVRPREGHSQVHVVDQITCAVQVDLRLSTRRNDCVERLAGCFHGKVSYLEVTRAK